MDNLIFDLTDLVERFSHSTLITGIQRVVISICRVAIAAGARAARFEECAGMWLNLPPGPVATLLGLTATVKSPADKEWGLALAQLHGETSRGVSVDFKPATILISLGAPWGRTNLLQSVRVQRRLYGFRYAAFVHDTVPIDFPEYCDGELSARFRQWFYSCVGTADTLIVNSAATAASVERACDDVGLVCPPMITCRLDGVPAASSQDIPWPSVGIRQILSERYVLFVATLEPRKNHLSVISAWRKLLGVLGEDAPLLVFAGARGWGADPVVKALEDPRLYGKVQVALDLTDADLASLYRNCMFTIYNSFWEGWGLPVTESISYGKIPVVPAHSGLLESGAGHAEFFAPDDERAFAERLTRLARDDDYRAARSREIAAARLASWVEIAADLAANLRTSFARPASPSLARLVGGALYRLSVSPPPQSLSYYRDAAVAEGLRGAGWHVPEDWGTWTSDPSFEIVGRVVGFDGEIEGQLDEDLTIYLAVKGHFADCQLVVRTGNGSVLGGYRIGAHRKTLLSLLWASFRGPELNLMFDQSGLTDLSAKPDIVDERRIGIGLISLMIGRGSDLATKCRFYESVLNQEAIVTSCA